jgi:hypothetical protein
MFLVTIRSTRLVVRGILPAANATPLRGLLAVLSDHAAGVHAKL